MKILSSRTLRLVLLSAIVLPLAAQTVSSQYFSGLHWRLVGPFRAGRVVAVSGVPGSATTYYFGGVDGGVWKTTDAGTVWQPVFDQEPVASIGSIAVAASDPNIIYAGTGESDIRSDLASGNGVYRSDDAGKTWTHIGLDDTRQISRILVSPTDPRTVYVAALGHAYGPNKDRGIYKSTDAGEHWTRVLDKGPDIGIADMAIAINAPNILFATTWNAHRPPWSTYAPLEGAGNALYRSTDGGSTWTAISGHGLPSETWGRTGIAVSADGRRVYATIDCKGHAGLYRSDDSGDSWALASSDSRLTSRAWYFNSITIDPQNPDTLYMPNVALYRTDDGGKTIHIVRGAPGGDDYHQVWVDPKDSSHLVLGVDQGASVSLDRGRTWTTWYNQPTAQIYHVTTDHKFPYTLYGAQQDSGAIAVHSRSDHGHVDTRDWFLPGGSESGYIAIDPKDENIVYLSGTYGGVSREDLRTSFSQNVTPWPLGGFDTEINQRRYRDPWTPVLVFSPADKTSLYLGTQYVMKTTDGGLHWSEISPDLTGTVKDASTNGPTAPDNAMQRGYGVVYTIAPSPLRADLIWAGSDTGRIHVTTDGGKTWDDVTPPNLSPWSKIALIEASHFDPATAYAAVDRHRLDDQAPYLYITHDYGKTWKLSVDGIAPHHFLRAVREDPEQRNLLYAGTEFGIYISFDAGGHWQPLQLNLPVTSIRDICVHESDLIVATHGRSFWILDDIAPLRQIAAAPEATAGGRSFLYAPPTTVRVDNDGFLGSPMPPEEPQADNPPTGAIIDYYLGEATVKVTLQILDAQGHVLRHFSSADKEPHRPPMPIADRWFPKPQELGTAAGEHRFVWDLAAGSASSAPDDDDAPTGGGPKVPPGTYTVRLNVATGLPENSFQMDKTLRVVMDPRSSATPAVLSAQFTLAESIYGQLLASRKAMAELDSVSSQLKKLAAASDNPADLTAALRTAQSTLDAIRTPSHSDAAPGLAEATSGLGAVLRVVESGDREAPASALEIFAQMKKASAAGIAALQNFKTADLANLNATLTAAHREPVHIAAIEEGVHYAMTR